MWRNRPLCCTTDHLTISHAARPILLPVMTNAHHTGSSQSSRAISFVPPLVLRELTDRFITNHPTNVPRKDGRNEARAINIVAATAGNKTPSPFHTQHSALNPQVWQCWASPPYNYGFLLPRRTARTHARADCNRFRQIPYIHPTALLHSSTSASSCA